MLPAVFCVALHLFCVTPFIHSTPTIVYYGEIAFWLRMLAHIQYCNLVRHTEVCLTKLQYLPFITSDEVLEVEERFVLERQRKDKIEDAHGMWRDGLLWRVCPCKAVPSLPLCFALACIPLLSEASATSE
jgi:hypothetical protein